MGYMNVNPREEKDKNKLRNDLELIYQAGLTYSATFNTLIIASAFGLFTILTLLQNSPKPSWRGAVFVMDPTWLILSIIYFLVGFSILYFYARTLLYSQVVMVIIEKLGIKDEADRIYRKAAIGSYSNFVTRVAYKLGLDSVYSPKPRLVVIGGVALIIALWIAIAVI